MFAKILSALGTLFSLWGTRFAGAVVGGLVGWLAKHFGYVVDPALVASLTTTVYGLVHILLDLLLKVFGSQTPPAAPAPAAPAK